MLLDCQRLNGLRPHCFRSSDGHSPTAAVHIKLKGKIFCFNEIAIRSWCKVRRSLLAKMEAKSKGASG